jgi:cytochrome P450
VQNGFLKTSWYKAVSIDSDNVFNTSDPGIHRRQRRLLSSPISESSLKVMIPAVDTKVKLTLQQIDKEMQERGAADVLKWASFMSTDVIAELTFGESFEMLEQGKV